MRDNGVGGHDPTAAGRSEAEDLARRAAARDETAWGELFERFYPRVFAFVRSRLAGASEAEDIAAQAFEVAFARADRFDYRGIPIEAWLIGIARNLARDHVKKAGRRGPGQELLESDGPVDADGAAMADLRQDLAAAMHHLTEDQQTVIALRFLLDLPVAEAAKVMDRSEDAVKNLQRRALAAMQRALTSAGYERSDA